MGRHRWIGALTALGLAAGAGGCAASGTGGSIGSGSSSAPSSVGLGPVPGSTGGSAGSASGSASGSTAPGSSGAGSAGAGSLRLSRGYGTYELCQGHCTGGVPAVLRRPLRLPTADGGPCPVTLHPAGPVTPSSSTEVGFARVTGSTWLAAEVTWTASSTYTGPVLIRGGGLGGETLGFGEGRVPYDALQLRDAGRVSPRVPAGARAWTTYTRIRQAGCYAYQVDGTNFSEAIVFRAVG